MDPEDIAAELLALPDIDRDRVIKAVLASADPKERAAAAVQRYARGRPLAERPTQAEALAALKTALNHD